MIDDQCLCACKSNYADQMTTFVWRFSRRWLDGVVLAHAPPMTISCKQFRLLWHWSQNTAATYHTSHQYEKRLPQWSEGDSRAMGAVRAALPALRYQFAGCYCVATTCHHRLASNRVSLGYQLSVSISPRSC